jgi:RNA polymerase sigma-70 factor (ECF subfamily)
LLYCLVPDELSPRVHELLRRHFRDDPTVEVLVERRGPDRRVTAHRRQARKPRSAPERRRIRGSAGRRIAERRELLVPQGAPELPRRVRPYASRLVFVERLAPAGLDAEDRDTARIVVALQAGDRQLFATLYERYFDRVYGYLRLVFQASHPAEDATQQVFLKVLEALPRYDCPPRFFRGWLFTIARNYARNQLRNERRVEPADVDRLLAQEPSAEADDLSVLDWISDDELNMLIERLPASQRQMLFLRYVVGLGTSEVAEILGQNPDAVRKQHARALGFLRARLVSLGRAPLRRTPSGARVLVRKTPVVRMRRFSLTSPN